MAIKLRLYLDTSVFSALYDERAPERQRLTQEFWAKLPAYEKPCSQLTLEELGRVGDPSLRERLLNLTAGFQVLPIGEAEQELARAYVAAGVVPVRYLAGCRSAERGGYPGELEFQALSTAQHTTFGELCQRESRAAIVRDLSAPGGVSMFALEQLKRESGLNTEQLAQLEGQVRAEFGEDELLRELHLVRALEALRRGWITAKEALSAEVKVP